MRTVTDAEYQFMRGAMAIWRGWQDMSFAEQRNLAASHPSFEWGFGQLEEWAPEIQQEQQAKLKKVAEQ